MTNPKIDQAELDSPVTVGEFRETIDALGDLIKFTTLASAQYLEEIKDLIRLNGGSNGK